MMREIQVFPVMNEYQYEGGTAKEIQDINEGDPHGGKQQLSSERSRETNDKTDIQHQ